MSCAPLEPSPACSARRGGEKLGFHLNLITVVYALEQATAYGLQGATQSGVAFSFSGQKGVANEDGSFEFSFSANLNEDVLLQDDKGDAVASFPALDPATLSSCLQSDSSTTGQTPNQVRLGTCGDESFALVTASADALVERIASDGQVNLAPTLFPPVDGIGAGPYHLHVEGEKAAVSLFGAHEIALLSTCDGEVLARSQHMDNPVVAVQPPLEFDVPVDALLDDTNRRSVGEMRVQHPQGVVLLPDGSLVAAFTNLLQPAFRTGEAQILGKSVLVRFVQEGNLLRPTSHRILDEENVQSLISIGGGTIVASATGALSLSENGLQAQPDAGALIFVAGETLELKARLPMPGYAPGTPYVDVEKGYLLVGSLLRATVANIRFTPDFIFSEAPDFALGNQPDGLDSVFELAPLPGGIVLAPQFNDDKAHAILPEGNSILRIPGVFPIDLSGGTSALRGPLSISSMLDNRGGVKAAVLLTFSSEVKILHFDRVFGANP
ncbi:MAG: hypothetical protein GY822_08785 [Deltaproteobacteria bacterium]|nr:hypothetical protein [Deltaproteobacteria bacterium]